MDKLFYAILILWITNNAEHHLHDIPHHLFLIMKLFGFQFLPSDVFFVFG